MRTTSLIFTLCLLSFFAFSQSSSINLDEQIFNDGLRYYEQKQYLRAIGNFGTCIAHNYKTDTSYFNLGKSLTDAGRTKEATAAFEKALELNPQYFDAAYSLGILYYSLEQYTKSISFYQQAAQINPSSDRAFFGLATAQLIIGQVNGAELNCYAALKLNPENISAKQLLDAIKRRKAHK